MWGPADAILDQLRGVWAIRRSISNGASLAGTAVFQPSGGDELRYDERGELTLAEGQRFAATRSYLFRRSAIGFDVYFTEEPGKLFHVIALTCRDGVWIGGGAHPCRDDLYRTRYAFRPDDSFVIAHTVRGPRHHYDMETVYRRQA
ncbi:MAG: hypothetical protein IT548_10480 [Alphaproteobacteria bacterium]|nr:hypothetical protein [Alphaproteobacteria bacterium]